MSVVIETTIGDITVDLFLEERPKACLNFLKLCKLKFYNYNLFHNIERNFIAQTGDPTGAGDGGESIWGVVEGRDKRFFEAESLPKIKHEMPGLLSLVSVGKNMVSSQFFFTLGQDLISLDNIHCVIGEVVEGHEILRKLNEAIVDEKFRPYQDIRITHTIILEDPFDDPRGFRVPSRSPSPSTERLKNGRIAADENIDDTEGKTVQEIQEMLAEREAKARATILEIVGDLPDAEIAPPENVLFVCKLNPVTTEDDLEIIFSRFGKVIGCEVIKDKISGDSLQYAFVEFEDKKACEAAYFKMDNVLIDDRRIHVDFSQSVSKVQWRGKGRGLIYKEGKDDRKLDFNNYKSSKGGERYRKFDDYSSRTRKRSKSPFQRNIRKSKRRSRSSSQGNKDHQRKFNDSRRSSNNMYERKNINKSRSRSPGRNISQSRYREDFRGRYENNRNWNRSYERRNQYERSRSRSPRRNYSSSSRYENKIDYYNKSNRKSPEKYDEERYDKFKSPNPIQKKQTHDEEKSIEKDKAHKKKSYNKISNKNKKTKKNKNKEKRNKKKESKRPKKKKQSSESDSTDSSSSSSTESSSSDSDERKKHKKKKKRNSKSSNSSSD